MGRQKIGLFLEARQPAAAICGCTLLQRQQTQLLELPPEQGLFGSGRQQQLPTRLAGLLGDLQLAVGMHKHKWPVAQRRHLKATPFRQLQMPMLSSAGQSRNADQRSIQHSAAEQRTPARQWLPT
jgi:hypothetical protein